MNDGAGTARLPRLLVLTSTYPRWREDPEPAFVHELSRRLVSRFDVTVLCPHAPGSMRQEFFDGVRVIRYRYAPEALETLVNDGGIVANLRLRKWKFLLVPGFILAQWWYAQRLIRRGDVDIVHAHWILPQGLVAALAVRMFRGRRVPFVVTSHGADLFALQSRVAQWLKRFVVSRASAITVVSEGMRQPVLDLGADPLNLSVEPMGVDLAYRFTPDSGVRRSDDEILFVGRLVEKKGLRHLIDAMALIMRTWPSAFLTVAGFGPELKERQEQAERLGLADRVRFLGAVKQKDLPELYRRASVFVAPFVEAADGDQDGLGLVVVEAAGCGCPVVVSEIPATKGLRGISPSILVERWSNAQELATIVSGASARVDRCLAGQLAAFDWEARARCMARIIESAHGGICSRSTCEEIGGS